MLADLSNLFNALDRKARDRRQELERMERETRGIPGHGGQFKNVQQAINYIRDKQEEIFALEKRMRLHQYDYMDRYPENHEIYAMEAGEIAERHGVCIALRPSKEYWTLSLVTDIDGKETGRFVLHNYLTLESAMRLGNELGWAIGLKDSTSPLGWITIMGPEDGEEDTRLLIEKSGA